jgi:transposase
MSEVTTCARWCGIDVSKKTFDSDMEACRGSKSRSVENRPSKFKELLDWAVSVAPQGAQVRFCMESTGDYGVELALFLVEEGYHVSVVNPARVKRFAEYKGYQNKTDKADARVIREYAVAENPPMWEMSDPARRQIFRLWRRLRQLVKLEAMEKGRLECPAAIGPACVSSCKTLLKALNSEIQNVLDQLCSSVERNETFKRASELIASIPVLSQISAFALLAEMPPVEKFECAKDWAAVAGGHPRNRRSGTSLDTSGMVKGGRKVLRSTLWMPTLAALNKMPEIRSFYDRLRSRGKSHRQALVACEHKLLMIVYGVLKRNRPYEKPEAAPTS